MFTLILDLGGQNCILVAASARLEIIVNTVWRIWSHYFPGSSDYLNSSQLILGILFPENAKFNLAIDNPSLE